MTQRKSPAITEPSQTPKGAPRQALERYLLDHRGSHTVATLAEALGVTTQAVRHNIRGAVTSGTAVNTNPGFVPARYQHFEHWQQEHRVNRREPITNACMPNGSREWWTQHMAAFNEPPRGA